MRDAGLLLAAHGERAAGADNRGVESLARALRARGVAAEVRCGFIKGTPTLAEAVREFAAARILVLPLFLADGYFSRVRLPQLLDPAETGRSVEILPPIGLHPALAGLVARKADAACAAAGTDPARTTLVLVAHGSTRDDASRRATEALAARIAAQGRFAEVRSAFLEEPPDPAGLLAAARGPVAVVGLFIGEGLHGREDVGRLVAGAGRADVVTVGNLGTWPDFVDAVARAVA